MEPPRSLLQRQQDTLGHLESDVDAWIASADAEGEADGTAEPVQDEGAKDAFAAKHGWDPRKDAGDYAWFRIVPDRVQAWREVNELPGRILMRDGAWLP